MKPSLGMPHTETESGSSESALRRSPRLLGKFELRRSPRLHGKSAMTVPQRSRISPRKSPANKGKSANTMPKHSQIAPCKSPSKGKSAKTMPERSQIAPRKRPAKGNGMTFCSHDSLDIETLMRADREHEAKHFKEMYTYSNDCREKKTCIHPGGVFEWEDNSSGITWVAVQGRSVTCVVFKRTLEHVKDRLRSYLRYNAPSISFDFFGTTIISEIEVLADLPSESSQKFPCKVHVDTPFAIVSVDPNTTNDQGEIVDKDATVNYLKGIIKKDKVFYCDEAEKAAIQGFHLLYNQKFEPDDIWVHVSFFGEEKGLPSYTIKHRLADINGGSSG